MILDGKEVVVKINGRTYHCALDITMAHIGGKWKTVVLWYIRKEPKRFGELKKLMPDITEKMLSLQLKALERDGIVTRKVYAEVPARVEYFLTKEGKMLLPILDALALWGRNRGEKYGKLEEVKKGSNKSEN